jgi:hypothetical protein
MIRTNTAIKLLTTVLLTGVPRWPRLMIVGPHQDDFQAFANGRSSSR